MSGKFHFSVIFLFVAACGQDQHGGEDSPAGRYSAKAEATVKVLTSEIRLKLKVRKLYLVKLILLQKCNPL